MCAQSRRHRAERKFRTAAAPQQPVIPPRRPHRFVQISTAPQGFRLLYSTGVLTPLPAKVYGGEGIAVTSRVCLGASTR